MYPPREAARICNLSYTWFLHLLHAGKAGPEGETWHRTGRNNRRILVSREAVERILNRDTNRKRADPRDKREVLARAREVLLEEYPACLERTTTLRVLEEAERLLGDLVQE